MTEASTWVAAARARAKEDLPYTGTYSANKVADEQIFGEVYKPSEDAKFDQAVQTVLDVQDVAFATPPSPAGAEFQKAWQDAVTGSWPARPSRPRPWSGPSARPRPRSTRPRAG
jgi:multiple sugar transport system substrate-binding protein